jgi:glycosyltransferase involved in cell wall biosynthesis
MRIAVNTRLLIPGKLEGIGWFTYETLKRITRLSGDNEFFFLFDRPFSEKFVFSDNITPLVLSPQARHPLLWYVWFEYSVNRMLRKINADLFLSPDGYLSLSSGVPSLPVIHDINFMHRPDFHPWLVAKYYRRNFPHFARSAKRIATVSHFSRNDIIRCFGIPPDKIDVCSCAAAISGTLDNEGIRMVKTGMTEGFDYFLYAGSLNKRKNICRLLEAYDIFRNGSGHRIKLMLAGEKLYRYPEMDRTLSAMKFRQDVILTGRLEPELLQKVYSASVALVYVPLYEGFGMPVIEAMNCEIPVIASGCTSLPEVTGDAALLVDPLNVNQIADAMHNIINDENLRTSLVMRGRKRRTLYSWDHTADLLLKSMQRAIDPDSSS